jgi:hypothetical protein
VGASREAGFSAGSFTAGPRGGVRTAGAVPSRARVGRELAEGRVEAIGR